MKGTEIERKSGDAHGTRSITAIFLRFSDSKGYYDMVK